MTNQEIDNQVMMQAADKIAELRHELANAQATTEAAMARIGELESQVQRQLAAAQELYRNSGVVKTAELLARIKELEAENARLHEADQQLKDLLQGNKNANP